MRKLLETKGRKLKIIVLAQAVILLLSCENKQAGQIEETAYPVEVERLKTRKETKLTEYFGIISSQLINYSFAMSGKVESVFVQKNQHVNKGSRLMQLETTGLQLALSAARCQMDQTRSAFREANSYYLNLKEAYESGGIAKSDLDKAMLDRDIKEKDFQQAEINLQSCQGDLNHATLIALSDGIVTEIVPKKGEVTNAGSETIIIQGTELFVETAISQKDLGIISSGTKAILEINNQKLDGEVTSVSALPDFQTFRHIVKINFTGKPEIKPAFLGQTVKVFFKGPKVSGIWLPIKHIHNDGESYVKVVENNRLRKKRISIIDFSGHYARVQGLTDNEMLIRKGAVNIKEGYKVTITNL